MGRRSRSHKNTHHKSLIKAILKMILLVLNVLTAFALFLSLISAVIPPAFILFISYCGLAFPYLLAANFFFVFCWLFIDYKWSALSLIIILLNVNNIDRYFQIRATEKPEVCANCVKVMSYNAKLFGLYDAETREERQKNCQQVFNLLRKEKPDIFCVQEYFWDGSGLLHFHTRDSIMDIMHIDNMKRNVYEYFSVNNKKKNYHYGMAIFSKYKIIDANFVEMGDSSTNSSIYVDIKYKTDTIRIYNVHLSSIRMNVEDYAMGRDIAQKGIDDPNLDKKAKALYGKIGKAFVQREFQAKALRAHMDTCKSPIILCGDFNDSPVSYAYHKVAHGFADAFRKSGGGRGQTYYGDAFPSFRIDYILHDKHYNSYGYTTCDSVKISDHYPIFTYISLLK